MEKSKLRIHVCVQYVKFENSRRNVINPYPTNVENRVSS